MKRLLLICMMFIAAALYAQEEEATDIEVSFHGFPWGTSMSEFTAKMGDPAHRDTFNGMQSLVYEDITVSGYPVFMLVYFSQNRLEGGTYYFLTDSYDELVTCYNNLKVELAEKFGPTFLFDDIYKEMAPYESSWNNLTSGYVRLKVDTRRNDPVTLWYSSPGLTERLGITRRL